MPSQHLLENRLNLLGLLGVDALNSLDLLAVLEDNDGGESEVLELLLGTGVLVDVDLVSVGVGGVLVSGPVRCQLPCARSEKSLSRDQSGWLPAIGVVQLRELVGVVMLGG